LSAYRHLSQFEGRAKFSTWLGRIAVRFAWLRSAQRARQIAVEPGDEIFTTLRTNRPGPEQTVSACEEAIRVSRAIENMPEKYREILLVRELHEAGTAAAAEKLGISESNVKVRLHRARAILRKELAKPAEAVWVKARGVAEMPSMLQWESA
jgi:RNA polymerase sigma-70 factor (ECF subfamily)